jgi:hypothetical protein
MSVFDLIDTIYIYSFVKFIQFVLKLFYELKLRCK